MAFYKCARVYVTENSNTEINTASGPIANFNTLLATPLLSLKANFEATQASGTPTPSAPIPIVGVDKVNIALSGKNLISHTSFGTFADWKADLVPYGDTHTSNSNRGFALPTKAGQTYTISFGITNESFPTYLYLCKANRVDTSSRIAYITTNTKVLNRTYTFTADSDLYYLRMNTYDEPTFNTQVSKCSYEQLEFGNQATTYEPYNGTTALINLGGTYYGGYVEQDKDGKRELVVTHKIQSFNVGNWSYGLCGNRYFFSQRLLDAKPNSVSSVLANSLCDIYEQQTPSNIYTHDTIGYCINNDFIRVQDNNYNSLDDWKNAVKNYNYVYELAEPFTIALPDGTPIKTLPGINNIFCDTGDTSLQFIKLGN